MTMKKALATITGEAGVMVLYFNGANEFLTAETADAIETIEDAALANLEQAMKLISWMYSGRVWDLRSLGEEALYVIKDEYYDHWGVTSKNPTVTGSEIVRLADEWGVSIAKLMEQVEA